MRYGIRVGDRALGGGTRHDEDDDQDDECEFLGPDREYGTCIDTVDDSGS